MLRFCLVSDAEIRVMPLLSRTSVSKLSGNIDKSMSIPIDWRRMFNVFNDLKCQNCCKFNECALILDRTAMLVACPAAFT